MNDSVVVALGLLVIAVVIMGEIWLLRQPTSPKKKKRQGPESIPRPRPHRHVAYDDDEPYESPLGFVDDPEDEWIEYAIMDEMFDGD